MGLTRPAEVLLFLQFVAAPIGAAQSHDVQWWEAAAVLGVVGAASLVDRGVDAWMQNHRSTGTDDVARAFRNGGQPAVVFGVSGGILAAGVISGRPALRRRGERVLASVVVAGLTTAAIKEASGRVRPIDTQDQYVFRPFSGQDAFPSGHATLAFALAASLSEEIKNPWAGALLYAGATGTAWSRVNDQRHWLSDVLAGAAVGITSAKVMEGRWRIFGLGPPKFLVDPPPGGARLEWRVRF